MNLWEVALETYEQNKKYVGVQLNKEGYTPLAPIAHMTTSAFFEIRLDTHGNFLSARAVDENEPKIIIPVTELSAGRTSAYHPHALCEQIGYLSGLVREKKDLYLEQLSAWNSQQANVTLTAVHDYVEKGTILGDLVDAKLIKLRASPEELMQESSNIEAENVRIEAENIRIEEENAELKKSSKKDKQSAEKKKPEKKLKLLKYPETKYDKALVRWVVVEDDGSEHMCWLDSELFDSWTRFYMSSITKYGVCMITGEKTKLATMHLKGIVPFYGNAKLVSNGDPDALTCRGMFSCGDDALTVGYEASQKIHNVLRWMVENNGRYVNVGGKNGCRTFLAWNPHTAQVIDVVRNPYESDEVFETQENYRNALYNWIFKCRMELLGDNDEDVIIAAFDAPSKGRLSLIYMNHLKGSDFLQRMYEWSSNVCWANGKFGIQTPPLKRLINSAYGIQRFSDGRPHMETADEIMRTQIQRLIASRLECSQIPKDLEQRLVDNACNPQNYDYNVWLNILWCACSVVSANIYMKSGENAMSKQLNDPDRSFQFGRLFAAMERIELDYYKKAGIARDTTAIKNMALFRRKPLDGYERINGWLETAYIQRAPAWAISRYRKLVGEIMSILHENYSGEELNASLTSQFMLGYSLQRNAFYEKEKKDKNANSI